MSQQELLNLVAARLDALGIEFMLTGSHASSLQGEARSTHDIDLVARLSSEHQQQLLNAFAGEQFYLSETAIAAAIQSRRMFNLLDLTTGEKVDFWVLTDSAFDQARFARRQTIDLGGQSIDVSSPEDTILMKLVWCRDSAGSERQYTDVLRVYELQGDLLDTDYIENWAGDLGVRDLWDRVVAEAELIDPTVD